MNLFARQSMDPAVEQLTRERMQSAYKDISPIVATGVVRAICMRVIISMTKVGWNKAMLSPTELFAADQIIIESLELLRPCLDATDASDLPVELQTQREEKLRTFCETHSQGESEEVPNWSEPCWACGEPKIYMWSVQTRSCDEPATDFLLCLSCGAMKRSS